MARARQEQPPGDGACGAVMVSALWGPDVPWPALSLLTSFSLI